jgi:hypothetical protein
MEKEERQRQIPRQIKKWEETRNGTDLIIAPVISALIEIKR